MVQSDTEKKPKRRRNILSKLTVKQLSALTTLKKDERNTFNKQRLVKLGLTLTTAFLATFSKSSIAHAAATPLLVTKGTVTPLLFSAPGVGIVVMPGMRGIFPYEVGRLPNKGAMFFALALFVTTALLRSAGDGYVKMMHLVARSMGLKVDDTNVEEDVELGLPTESDWGTYSRDAVEPLQRKAEVEKVKELVFNPHTMMFEKAKVKSGAKATEEEEKLQKANQYFQAQQYKQHHHPVHVARSKYEQTSYLDTLAINEEEHHDNNMPKGYLDTLSNDKRSTWDDYKVRLDEAKPVDQVGELKQEVTNLQTLMQIEQSMYQTSNQALKLAMDAQSEEHHHSFSNEQLKDFDEKLSTSEELKAFDKKAQEFDATVGVKNMSKTKVEGSEKLAS